jgi:hypothetical protein
MKLQLSAKVPMGRGVVPHFTPLAAIMKAILRCCLCLAASGASVALADQAAVRVVASSDLRLVIVDSARATPARDALHRAFAASLGKAMGDTVGGPVAVRMKCEAADQAAFGLSNGGCHVVLSIGKNLPRPLVLSGTSRLTATLGAGKNEREAFLIFSNEDAGLEKLLTKSFASAITDNRFLDALDGGLESAPDPTKGQKLASTGP